jgi:hypothetical protein
VVHLEQAQVVLAVAVAKKVRLDQVVKVVLAELVAKADQVVLKVQVDQVV